MSSRRRSGGLEIERLINSPRGALRGPGVDRADWTELTAERSHPPGEHDDGVDALMLATMRLARRMQETLGAASTKQAVGKLVF